MPRGGDPAPAAWTFAGVAVSAGYIDGAYFAGDARVLGRQVK